jgi:hypothetical protein
MKILDLLIKNHANIEWVLDFFTFKFLKSIFVLST